MASNSSSSSGSQTTSLASSASQINSRRHQYEPDTPSQLRESTKPPSTATTSSTMEEGQSMPFDRSSEGREEVSTTSGGDQSRLETESEGWSRQRRSVQYPSVPGSPTGNGGKFPGDLGEAVGERGDNIHGLFGDTFADGLMGSKTGKSTTGWLAERHGVKHSRLMYAISSFTSTVEANDSLAISIITFLSSNGFVNTDGRTSLATSLQH